jgi:uncharacterized protein YkwD
MKKLLVLAVILVTAFSCGAFASEAVNPAIGEALSVDSPVTGEPSVEAFNSMTLRAVAGSHNAEYAREVLRLTNLEREKAGLTPFAWASHFESAVNIRAEEISEVFSHARPDGTTCWTAIPGYPDFPYEWYPLGENIAAGQTSPAEVVTGWMNSAGHRANILNPRFAGMAVGCYLDDSGRLNWVQLFSGYGEILPEEPVKDGWLVEDGVKRYYIDGAPASGYMVVDGAWRYFRADGQPAEAGCYIQDSYWRYFGEDGLMYAPGFHVIMDRWRYVLDGSIVAPPNWYEAEGQLRYVADGGLLVYGWHVTETDGVRRYFLEGSIPARGWVEAPGEGLMLFDDYGKPV